MTVRDSSLVTLKEPQDYDPAPGAKRGSETGTRLGRVDNSWEIWVKYGCLSTP